MTICGHCGADALRVLADGAAKCADCGSRNCTAPSRDEIEAEKEAIRTARSGPINDRHDVVRVPKHLQALAAKRRYEK